MAKVCPALKGPGSPRYVENGGDDYLLLLFHLVGIVIYLHSSSELLCSAAIKQESSSTPGVATLQKQVEAMGPCWLAVNWSLQYNSHRPGKKPRSKKIVHMQQLKPPDRETRVQRE